MTAGQSSRRTKFHHPFRQRQFAICASLAPRPLTFTMLSVCNLKQRDQRARCPPSCCSAGVERMVGARIGECRIMQRHRHYSIVEFALVCFLALSLAITAHAQWAPRNPVTAFQKQADGLLLTMKVGTLKLQVCTDTIIRVRYSAT